MSNLTRAVESRRVLSPAQAATQRKLLDAALRLATERGYDGVGMREVAAAAGVSPATAYTYFASKDHLLAETLGDWTSMLTARLEANPPAGATPADRVVNVLRRAAQGVRNAPKLASAVTLAVVSLDPSVRVARRELDSAMARWIDIAIGTDPVPDRARIIEILELAFFALMVSHANGARTADDLAEVIERTARYLLR